MCYNSNGLLRVRSMIFCKLNCFIQGLFSDWKVTFFHGQLYEYAIPIFVDFVQLMNYFTDVFPLIQFQLGKQNSLEVLQNILILPISLFDRLIRWYDGFARKLSLWSFSMAYQCKTEVTRPCFYCKSALY